jgi:hypothetical protein
VKLQKRKAPLSPRVMNIHKDSPLVFVTPHVCLAVWNEMRRACMCEGPTGQFLLVSSGVSCTGSLLLSFPRLPSHVSLRTRLLLLLNPNYSAFRPHSLASTNIPCIRQINPLEH